MKLLAIILMVVILKVSCQFETVDQLGSILSVRRSVIQQDIDGLLKSEPVKISNGKLARRSNDFYEDPDNIGYYAYHGKNVRRSNDFYEDPDNIGYYAYHGKNVRRSNDFYEDPDNIGYYAYHGKNVRRSNDFYEDPDNIGYYAYHGKNLKKRYEDNESETSYESFDVRRSRKLDRLLIKQRSTQIPKDSEFVNITNCQYTTTTEVLTCFNHLVQNATVECQASLNQSDLSQFNFNMFGIEISSDQKFNLYPFKMNNETHERIFYNYQIRVNENNIDLGLFHAKQESGSNGAGISIRNATCFGKLSDLLIKSAELKSVDFKISSKDVLTKIVFIGDIFVDQKPGSSPKIIV